MWNVVVAFVVKLITAIMQNLQQRHDIKKGQRLEDEIKGKDQVEQAREETDALPKKPVDRIDDFGMRGPDKPNP